jgi:hypothetical protein
MQHKDVPTRHEIESLARIRQEGCVSIYLPSGVTPPEADMARLALKNQLRTAVEQLESTDSEANLIEAITGQVHSIEDDRDFWRYQSRSLALFVNSSTCEVFRLPNIMTTACEVSDRFYIKPLLRSVTFPQSAYVLALSQHSVRLIDISAAAPATEVKVSGMPSEVGYPTGRLQADEGAKVMMREFALAIQNALRPVLATATKPLILAAAEPMAGIYRQVSTYPHLADSVIAGSPELRSGEELATLARPILDELNAAELTSIRQQYNQRFSQGLTVTDLSDVARAATYNAIDTLFVDIDQHIPGFVNELDGRITLSPQDDAKNYGVVDEIVRRSLLEDARIFAVRAGDVPGGGPVAASIRFNV